MQISNKKINVLVQIVIYVMMRVNRRQGELEGCEVIPTEGTICAESLRCKKAWHMEGVEKLSASQCARAWWKKGGHK